MTSAGTLLPLPNQNTTTTTAVFEGDALHVMRVLGDHSVDMVLADLPYGTTYAPWDSVIPIAPLWEQLLRVTKPGAAIVLTASQPFTSMLVMSQPKLFRCEWIWNKVNGANFANANRQPLKTHESVLVFATAQPTYNPQKTRGPKNHSGGGPHDSRVSPLMRIDRSKAVRDDFSGMKFPNKSIVTFPKHSSQSKLHRAQKPVELFEYPHPHVLEPRRMRAGLHRRQRHHGRGCQPMRPQRHPDRQRPGERSDDDG